MSDWRRTTMRGCGPRGNGTCLLMNLPVENREVDGRLEVRHVYPKARILAILERETRREILTGKDASKWWAVVSDGSRASSQMRRVYGATEREALQNLGERYRIDWRPCREIQS